jgi:hypothetical protein
MVKLWRLCAAAQLLACILLPAHAAEPKDCALFASLDLLVQRGGGYYRVVGVHGDGALVRIGEKDVRVPFREIGTCRILQQPEVSDWRATIDHLEAERIYTRAADPRRDWQDRELGLTAYREDRIAALSTNFNGVVTLPQGAFANPLSAIGSIDPGAALGVAVEDASGEGHDAYYAEKSEEELDKQLFDAVRIGFEISAPLLIAHPYLICVTDYRESGKAPDVLRRICILELAPVNGAARKVSMTVGGFPPGFTLVRTRVHLYESDREIATTASEPRVDMSRSEMFRYLEVQYAALHKGRTLPPSPIRGHSQVTVLDKVDPGQLGQTLEVKVSRDGEVVDWSAADSGSLASSVPVNAFLRDLHFYPALDKGAPVDGTVRATLSDLAQ